MSGLTLTIVTVASANAITFRFASSLPVTVMRSLILSVALPLTGRGNVQVAVAFGPPWISSTNGRPFPGAGGGVGAFPPVHERLVNVGVVLPGSVGKAFLLTWS